MLHHFCGSAGLHSGEERLTGDRRQRKLDECRAKGLGDELPGLQ